LLKILIIVTLAGMLKGFIAFPSVLAALALFMASLDVAESCHLTQGQQLQRERAVFSIETEHTNCSNCNKCNDNNVFSHPDPEYVLV
jgi:hypothetical protein